MHRFSARWAKPAAVLLALSLLGPLVAAGVAAQDAGGKVLRIHHPVYPDIVDPQKSSYVNEIDILALVYEGLTRLDSNLQTIPAAAERWEYNAEGTQLTFFLREGLTYSDGSPLTADNFRYAIERNCDPNTAGEYQAITFEIAGCEEFAGLLGDDPENPVAFTEEQHEAARQALGVEVVDERTLRMSFTRPAPYYHTVASTWPFYPTKREIVEQDPEGWWLTAENHVGNGPFTITGIEQDQRWTFAANETYWQGRPKLDGIEYIYIDDAAVALESYRTGDLDIVQLEPSQIIEVKNDPELSEEYLEFPLAATYYLAFNLKQEPFNDKKVREAFAYAIDRETLCAEVRSGDCVPTLSWVPPGVPGYIETDKFGFNPDAAKQALAESSYGGPENLPEIRFTYNSERSGATERAEWLVAQFRELLGIEVVLEPVDGTTLASLSKDISTYPQMHGWAGWGQDYPDPQNWLSVYWTCDSEFATQKGYCNEEFDRLVEQGDTTVDPEQRITFYEQAGQILIDDVPGPFAFNILKTAVVSPRVTGYTPTPMDSEWPGEFASLMSIDITEG